MDSRTDPPDPATLRNLAPADPPASHSHAPSTNTIVEFSLFYRNFYPNLVVFLIWQGVRSADAAEIAQDTMTKLLGYWETVQNPASWARRVASRAYAKRLAEVPEDPVVELPRQSSLPILNNADLESVVERNEVIRLLRKLPARQRQVMAWHYDGYSTEEIARELKMTNGAVRAALFRARQALAGHLLTREEMDMP
ncbi:RNA polymerase sigma factor, sigma-70 family [Frankia sp. AiPs1]|uniref:RNA polymerase sigma factor n=1 Tax=Frankia sp. AiPa1 TaxID=573492 RepID=UPI00202B5245|nr:sigma-70 family RNA polymerase sigma factor [Frankia sp. AiPa1]MCL9760893.1 sigma-70 family RNA polymerase sigma factor [Frankia sp. AiPa1]